MLLVILNTSFTLSYLGWMLSPSELRETRTRYKILQLTSGLGYRSFILTCFHRQRDNMHRASSFFSTVTHHGKCIQFRTQAVYAMQAFVTREDIRKNKIAYEAISFSFSVEKCVSSIYSY